MSRTDLYSLLKGFAVKKNSSRIRAGEFVGFIEKYAEKKSREESEWTGWAKNASAMYREEITALAESGECVLLNEGGEEYVFIPAFCRRCIEDAYRNTDAQAGFPFPDEASFGLNIPKDRIRKVNLISDMGMFFGLKAANDNVDTVESISDSNNTIRADDIISLQFSQNYGSALMLAAMIPRKLMETSLLKIRFFLKSLNNKDYILSKLSSQMPGKETILRDFIERIMIRPLDCLGEMERSADFPYLFWTYFCPLAKNDIRKKNDLLPEDLAAIQAICAIEMCCGFYRAIAAKKRDIDAAFRALETQMEQPPWYYNLEQITGFTNDRKTPLLSIYSQKRLEDYIRKAVGTGVDGLMPSWVVIKELRNERWYLKKEKYLPLCARSLLENQPLIKAAIIKRWTKILRNYDKELSMNSDAEFEKLLERYTKTISPFLQIILEDPKLLLIYEEMERIPGAITQATRLFRDGILLPYSILFNLKRKHILSDIKYTLPFWYSIPFIVTVLAFFRKLGGKKKMVSRQGAQEDTVTTVEKEPNELHKSALMIQAALVPDGKTLDEYLVDLETRWSHLINEKDRKNLLIDLHSLLKDNLRNMMKVYKLKKITSQGLQEMSSLLITRNGPLQSLREQKALRMYMELYTLKLLLSRTN